ncbi:MAG: helix-turn-helix domain-containing protein [Muribaculaceae bacterium]
MDTGRSQHPVLSSNAKIREHGIVVLNDVTSMPVYGVPLSTENLIIALNLGGSLTCEFDTLPVEYKYHDITVLMPNHTVNAVKTSDDYRVNLLVMSPEAFEQMKFDNPASYKEGLYYHRQAHFHLDDKQFENIYSVFKLLHSVCESESLRNSTLKGKLLDVLFGLLAEFRKSNGEVANRQPSQHEEILTSFIEAVTKHYDKSREVRYYADMLCLSPKYFAAIIKQQTGVNASTWISNYVVVQAKTLLRYHRNLTVQQIAIRLGFTDQASFSRFFKKKTGQSPSEYR